jgi:hypothetical protein
MAVHDAQEQAQSETIMTNHLSAMSTFVRDALKTDRPRAEAYPLSTKRRSTNSFLVDCHV